MNLHPQNSSYHSLFHIYNEIIHSYFLGTLG